MTAAFLMIPLYRGSTVETDVPHLAHVLPQMYGQLPDPKLNETSPADVLERCLHATICLLPTALIYYTRKERLFFQSLFRLGGSDVELVLLCTYHTLGTRGSSNGGR